MTVQVVDKMKAISEEPVKDGIVLRICRKKKPWKLYLIHPKIK